MEVETIISAPQAFLFLFLNENDNPKWSYFLLKAWKEIDHDCTYLKILLLQDWSICI